MPRDSRKAAISKIDPAFPVPEPTKNLVTWVCDLLH